MGSIEKLKNHDHTLAESFKFRETQKINLFFIHSINLAVTWTLTPAVVASLPPAKSPVGSVFEAYTL